ncbi:MAG: response regulator, partial [Verrucomicrobiia bacterium]
MKLLIVDDSMVVRETIERTAHRPEIDEIYLAENGLQAVELFEQHRPELVTMDLTMPELDGLDCIAKIRAMDDSAAILVVSAINSHDTAMTAIERGACGFLTKPFTV